MSDLMHIEELTRGYSQDRDVLSARVGDLTAEMEAIQRRKMPGIKKAVGLVAAAHAALLAALEAAPHLFVKPRTHIFHGVKVGFTKGRGKLEWEDDEQVIRLIRKKLPEELHDVLINVKETVAADALQGLTTEQLRSIGVQVDESGDRVVIKPVDGTVEKTVKSLLKNAESLAEEARKEAA